MAQPFAHPAQPGILFRDPAFLAQVPLSPTTVSQYFSLSPFFSRASTNEQLRMQSLAEPDGGARREPRELEEALRRFRGTEFVVAHAAPQPPPGLYVIHQRERWGPAREDTRLVDAFFCLDGNIARAPDLYSVVGNRVVSAAVWLRRHTPDASRSWLQSQPSSRRWPSHTRRSRRSIPAPASAGG